MGRLGTKIQAMGRLGKPWVDLAQMMTEGSLSTVDGSISFWHNQVLPGGVLKPPGFIIVTVLVVTKQVVESHLSLDWVLVRTQVHLASVGLAAQST